MYLNIIFFMFFMLATAGLWFLPNFEKKNTFFLQIFFSCSFSPKSGTPITHILSSVIPQLTDAMILVIICFWHFFLSV